MVIYLEGDSRCASKQLLGEAVDSASRNYSVLYAKFIERDDPLQTFLNGLSNLTFIMTKEEEGKTDVERNVDLFRKVLSLYYVKRYDIMILENVVDLVEAGKIDRSLFLSLVERAERHDTSVIITGCRPTDKLVDIEVKINKEKYYLKRGM